MCLSKATLWSVSRGVLRRQEKRRKKKERQKFNCRVKRSTFVDYEDFIVDLSWNLEKNVYGSPRNAVWDM